MLMTDKEGDNFLARNKYGQLLHFLLARIHVSNDMRKFYLLKRLDINDDREHCYSAADMAEMERVF